MIYTVPPLTDVDFALTAHSAPSLTSPQNVLTAYTVPALTAVAFALTAYTVPSYMDVGWELLPSSSFPTQYAGLRFYNGSVGELALVDVADTPAGPQWRVYKGAQAYAVYLVATTDPDASPIRVYTSAGVMAARNKT